MFQAERDDVRVACAFHQADRVVLRWSGQAQPASQRWGDGNMRRRSCAAGLVHAEGRFRRLKGLKHLYSLIKALDSIVEEKLKTADVA